MIELVSLVDQQFNLLSTLQHSVDVRNHDIFHVVDLRFDFGDVVSCRVRVESVLKNTQNTHNTEASRSNNCTYIQVRLSVRLSASQPASQSVSQSASESSHLRSAAAAQEQRSR